MSEDQMQDVVEEVVAPESAESKQEVSQEPHKGSQEYNFREMRRLLEEQQRRIKELESIRLPEQKASKDDEDNLADDDFVTVKQAKKMALREAQELIQQQEAYTLEDRTRLKYRDYDDVVTENNVKQLIEDDQDLAYTIQNSPNPYVSAYKLIKKSAFYKGHENMAKKQAQEAERITKNTQKPASASSINSKPLSEANTYASYSDEQLKTALREMEEYARRRV